MREVEAGLDEGMPGADGRPQEIPEGVAGF
jgi:hypothetical protein